jgi:hypothetical protein
MSNADQATPCFASASFHLQSSIYMPGKCKLKMLDVIQHNAYTNLSMNGMMFHWNAEFPQLITWVGQVGWNEGRTMGAWALGSDVEYNRTRPKCSLSTAWYKCISLNKSTLSEIHKIFLQSVYLHVCHHRKLLFISSFFPSFNTTQLTKPL